MQETIARRVPVVACALALAFAGCVTPRIPMTAVSGPDAIARTRSQDPLVRVQAAKDLTFDPDPAAIQLLLVMLGRDVAPTVRAASAAAIAERRDPTFLPALRHAATTDPDAAVRMAAAAAHEKLLPWAKSPTGAAAMSAMCPGCGQMYLGRYELGAAQLAATSALLGGGLYLIQDTKELALGRPLTSSRSSVGLVLTIAGQNMWFYSVFDAYRDARKLRGDVGYDHAITDETLDDLLAAPFTPRVLASPWVWGGVPLMLAAGLALSYLVSPGELTGTSITKVKSVNFLGNQLSPAAGFAAGEAYYATLFAPVGVGEEALFRGMVQSELEERWGTYGGLAGASAIFGGVHAVNFVGNPGTALVAVPFIGAIGSVLGMAYIRTGYRLETSVAMHFWYDFLLSSAAFALDPENQPFVVDYTGRF